MAEVRLLSRGERTRQSVESMVGFLNVRLPATLDSSSLRLLLLLRRTLATTASSNTPKTPTPALPPQPLVAVFWDLHNKPPNSIPPYDAAVRLNLAAASFGPVRFTVAYANHHAFRHVPAPLRSQRADRRALDPAPAPAPADPCVCRVCGRNFYNHTKFLNHFRQIHEREQAKRQNRLESARGARRVKLAAQLSMKMDKYRRAAREVLVPRVGYGLADELRRAGVWVRTVDDRPEAADRALRAHMVDEMDRGRIGCLVLVSDDAGFAGVLSEARMRCLMTVTVGDEGDGPLKRYADAGFSWKEIVSGKARKEAASALGRRKDRDLLKKLEWTYVPESGRAVDIDDLECESVVGDGGDGSLGLVGKRGSGPWWKLDSDTDESSESDYLDEGLIAASTGQLDDFLQSPGRSDAVPIPSMGVSPPQVHQNIGIKSTDRPLSNGSFYSNDNGVPL